MDIPVATNHKPDVHLSAAPPGVVFQQTTQLPSGSANTGMSVTGMIITELMHRRRPVQGVSQPTIFAQFIFSRRCGAVSWQLRGIPLRRNAPSASVRVRLPLIRSLPLHADHHPCGDCLDTMRSNCTGSTCTPPALLFRARRKTVCTILQKLLSVSPFTCAGILS